MLWRPVVTVIAAVAGCVASVGAQGDAVPVRALELCPAIREAVAIGEHDWSFASLQSAPIPTRSLFEPDKADGSVPSLLQIPGFRCEVRNSDGSVITPMIGNGMTGATGFFDCNRYDLRDGGAEAMRIAGILGHCLGIAPTKNKVTFGYDYFITVRDNPKLTVEVMPNGLQNEGVIVQVLSDNP